MNSNNSKTISKETLNPEWQLIDAKDEIQGRLCSKISLILQGKNKTNYVKHLNNGDFVVVVNTDKIKVTGKKLTDKKYYNYRTISRGFIRNRFN